MDWELSLYCTGIRGGKKPTFQIFACLDVAGGGKSSFVKTSLAEQRNMRCRVGLNHQKTNQKFKSAVPVIFEILYSRNHKYYV